MTTIPQLRKDIHSLQDEVARLQRELAAEKSKPPVVKEVIKEIERVVYRDNPKHLKMIRKLQGRK